MEIVNEQGYVEKEKDGGRTPVLSGNTSSAQTDIHGKLYVEKEVNGVIGRVPVIELLGVSGGTNAVASVNGETGAVVLTASDVGAEPAFVKKTAFNKDFGTTANTLLTGDSSLNITKQGFVKNGSSDAYLLLGGGGHKLLSTLPIYEEGNWTPSVFSTGNARFSIAKAEYVRIGRAIDIYCDLTITTAGTNNIGFALNGLPFIPKSNAMIGTCIIVNGGKEFIDTYCSINANQSTMWIGKRTDHTSGYVDVLHNELKVGARIVVAGKYFV